MKVSRLMRAQSRAGEEEELRAARQERLLLQEEIWRLVAEADGREASFSAQRHARRLEREFPQARLSLLNITDALVYAAVDAGVVVEMRAGNSRGRKAGHEGRQRFRAVAAPLNEPVLTA